MMTYQQILDIVKEYDSKLLATNKGFRNCVQIIHEEGTVLLYQNAFMRELDGWIVVFTEHHGFHIYDKEDLYGYSLYTRNYKKVKKLEV